MIDRIIDILSYQADNPLMFNSKLFWILFMLFIPLYGWLIPYSAVLLLITFPSISKSAAFVPEVPISIPIR